MGTSSDKCHSACARCGFVVFRAAEIDSNACSRHRRCRAGSTIPATRKFLAERRGCRVVRDSSVASRIGSLDRGAQRCSQRRLFYADAFGLRELRAKRTPKPREIFARRSCFRTWPDVQTDTGHGTVRVTAFGLLAAGENAKREGRSAKRHSLGHFRISGFQLFSVGSGETSAIRAVGGFMCHNGSRATRRARGKHRPRTFRAGDNGLIAYAIYLRQTVFPSALAVVYPYPQGQLHLTDAFLAGILLLVLTLLSFWQRKQRPFLIVGWLWFLGMLVPMIGIIQVGSQPHADRYTYLAQVGLFCGLSWLAIPLIETSRKYRTAYFAAGVIVIAAFGSRSYAQCRYWHDSGAIWEHAIAVTDGNYVAYNNFGDVLMDKGQLDDAINYYRKAVELRPGYAQAQSNLGNLLLRKGQTDEALSHLEKAKNFAEGFNNIASGYMQKGRIEEAITYYQRAIEIDPNYAEAHNNLGVALLQNHRVDDAITQYRRAVEIKPESAELQCNLGNAFASKQDWPAAVEAYESALHARPNYAKARNNLGVALEQLGKRDEAFAQFEQNVQENPNYAEAHCNFGRVLGQRGRTEEAIAHLTEALRLQPDYAEAKKQLSQLETGR